YLYRDSATSQEHQNAIQEMQLIYNTEKQEAELEILKKDNAIAENEKKRAQEESEYQSTITSYLSVGGIIVLLLGIFVFIKYRESQKQKALISEQKHMMEFQKALVEEKNKDITDSMIYASSIQKAIITSDDYFKEMFRDFFVIYKPKDIVSGDFYWAYETKDGKKLIAVGDCTGHGVPGAMMSMLGTAFLNEIVIERKTMRPGVVLERLRKQVKRALQNNESKDGMDMSFCLIEGSKMTFAGANLPVYVVRDGELTEIKGDKQPIGYQPTEEKPFTEHVFELQENDTLYLFSDGYADQFGGEKGKKYKYKTFRDRLKVVSQKALKEQREIITQEFDQWKGELEQLDDVCVVGVKI
ncbi:MAG: serine/threonine-protein phosphatase, partial [Crocinitomicaceae bacterium]|nr:serine/threonine-protein phosphatase [Crocinitomicaceae bacterium]